MASGSPSKLGLSVTEALDVVADAMRNGERRHFQIALVGYWLDRCPYPADGLAVSQKTTPDFVRTDEGFVCESFFPPKLLRPETVSARGVIRSPSGVEMVRVTLAVHERDVWAISEFVDGRQQDLFVNSAVMVQRKFAFAHEATKWHAAAPRTRH